jgi:polar amino acid transport system substrate-binding protein
MTTMMPPAGKTKLLSAMTIFLAVAGPVHAQTAKPRVVEEGTIVIGIHNRAPWGYRDASTGEPTGWHPDIVRAAFAELGVTDVELRVTEFGALIPGLLAGRFDAVASGLAITPERCKQVAFAEPDLKVPDAAVVLEGNPEQIHGYADIASMDDVILGAGRGSVVAKNAMAAGVPDERILLFPDIESNISALRAGRIDVAAFSSATVIGLLSGSTTQGLERALPFETSDDQANYAAIAFQKEDQALRHLYNQRLVQMKADGTIAEIMNKYGFGQPEAVPEGITMEDLCKAGQ